MRPPTNDREAYERMPEPYLRECVHLLPSADLRALASAIFQRRAPYSVQLAEHCLGIEAVRRGWPIGAFRVLRAVWTWGALAGAVAGVAPEDRAALMASITRTPTHDEAEIARKAPKMLA